MHGTVWIVATPLGNLGDFSPRAREVLEQAELILAEDTRRSGQLLSLAGIAGKRLVSLHEHNEAERIDMVLEHVGQGLNAAVVSDAGTPLIADPGYRLVAACRTAGISVVPVPGPCAPIAALMACGLPPYPFVFLGFLPRKAGDVRSTLAQYAGLPATLVFFERKNRVGQTLDTACEVLGEREFCLARELTKKHEQFISGRLGQPVESDGDLLGEITVVIGPPLAKALSSVDEVRAAARQLLGQGLRPKEAARQTRELVSGWSVKQIYELMLNLDSE